MDHMKQSRNPPNDRLRYQREKHGWSQNRVADELFDLCQRGGKQKGRKRGDINAQMVSKWELGQRPGPFWQEKLSELYGVSVEDLGLVKQPWESEPPHTIIPPPTSSNQRVIPTPLVSINMTDMLPYDRLTRNQAFDMLCKTEDTVPAQKQLGAWLAIGAGDLAQLFDEGWSVEDILGALQFVLRGVKAMHKFSRRQLFQLGAAAVISGVPVPEGRHVSTEDRTQLCSALGENIGAGWQMFHTAGNAQVLAVGQAQLLLLHQCQSMIPSHVQPLLYSPVYRLIGAALHFQGFYDDAFDAHNKAYVAALEGADAWNMAQSRIWQASALKDRKQYTEALQTIEAALRLVSTQNDVESIRTTAHLFASGAEIAALTSDKEGVKSRLHASEECLEYLPGQHEEFDCAGWHEMAGVCAIHLKQYDLAIRQLKQAAVALPPQSTLRHASTLMPLVMAYANIHERKDSITTAEKAIPIIQAINAPSINRQFVAYTTCSLLDAFPDDPQIQDFVVDMQRQLLPQKATLIVN